MAEPRITKIIYREYADDLFDGQDMTGIDVSASASEFLAQLKVHLEQEYPGVRVVTEEVAQPIGHDRRILVETEPINDEDGTALRLSEDTAVDVQQIASDLYEQDEWYIEADEPMEPKHMKFTRHNFGNSPDLAFARGGLLDGFDPDAVDYTEETEQAGIAVLAESFAVDVNADDELVLGRLADGRLAVVGLTVEGHPFWVQEHES